jgi:hypothetical protein
MLPSEDHRNWQWPLSSVHSAMMIFSAQPADGGGCTPSPFRSLPPPLELLHPLPSKTSERMLPILILPFSHKVRIYKEYHSVCPLVGIGTLPPLSRQRVRKSQCSVPSPLLFACNVEVAKAFYKNKSYVLIPQF